MLICDIWWTIRKKHGWLADCKEVGYTKEELDEMEELEDSYHVNLTSFYGEDYSSMNSPAIKRLSKKLK